MIQPQTIALRFYNTGSDWIYEHTIACGVRRYRVHIRRNAYDFQSSITGFVYSHENSKWNELVHRPIDGSRASTVSYVCKDPDRHLFDDDAEEVFEELRAIAES